MDPDSEIDIDFFPLLRQYKSGRVERLRGTDVVPAGADPATGVASKDVTVDPSTGVSARLYLPPDPDVDKKQLPVLVFYHGGGFIIHTAASPTYHDFLNAVAAQAGVLAVSVDYRRAPEHPLPAAYDDSRAALRWIAGRADPWLADHGDLRRVFLAGDSAGANIAHYIAVRVRPEVDLGPGVGIKGLALDHPYFWGATPIASEPTEPAFRGRIERLWEFTCPATDGADDPRLNPLAAGAPGLEKLACESVLVCVAEKDMFKERGKAYYEGVKKSGYGGEVEVLESEGEGHAFHLFDYSGVKSLEKMQRLVSFLTRD